MANRCDAVVGVGTSEIQFESQSEWSRKWEQDIVTYSFIRDSEDIPGRAEERKALNLAMTTWDLEIPLKLKWVRRNQNPDITIEFKTKVEEPHFRDHPATLAYAYFPGQGEISGIIIFNEEYRWSLDGRNMRHENRDGSIVMVKTYNLIQVLVHEIGHSIGLRHSESSTKDVMNPYYNGGTMTLSPEDIYRIRKIYGTRLWNWRFYTRVKNWLYHRKRRY